MRTHICHGLAVICLVALAACDSGTDGPGARGSFEATLSGGITRSLSGDAVFSVQGDPPSQSEDSITITMADAGFSGRTLSIVDLTGQIDGEGTYALDPDDLNGLGMVYFDLLGGGVGTLASVSGSVTVTRFEDDRISGTFQADLGSLGSGEDADVWVEGEFDAVEIVLVSF